MPDRNYWYFYREREVVELEPNPSNSYWLQVVGKPNWAGVDSWEERNRLFNTKEECLKYAIGLISAKRDKLAVVKNALEAELIRHNLTSGKLFNAGD